ncbi:MAG: hypothetical protein ACRDP8_20130 [Actinopolymorphaceae bacterium]
MVLAERGEASRRSRRRPTGWRRLSTVRENRAFNGDQDTWFNAADVEGVNLVLNDLFAQLT